LNQWVNRFASVRICVHKRTFRVRLFFSIDLGKRLERA
jgi:hypothetical protein